MDPIPKDLGSLNKSYGDFVAVFWAHSDISNRGSVEYYMVDSSNTTVTHVLKELITAAFPDYKLFSVELAVSVRWTEVGYWDNGTDKVNK